MKKGKFAYEIRKCPHVGMGNKTKIKKKQSQIETNSYSNQSRKRNNLHFAKQSSVISDKFTNTITEYLFHIS